MNFANKNILITGGTRGIGKAVALAFANGGGHVGLNYKSDTMAAKATLRELGNGNHKLFQCDISEPDGAEKLFNSFLDHYGTIDILINNAGISIQHPIVETSIGDWKQAWIDTFQTNLFTAANLCHLAAQAMIKSGGGRIVNISSRGAFRGEPAKPAYGASKAALNAMSQSLAKALAPHHIYVGTVAPGFTDTEMGAKTLTPVEKERLLAESPFKRMAKPEEVAHAVLFLASVGAEYSSGTIIDVNGASYFR